MTLSTWKKYYFKELLKVFILFILCFYFLYVLIDYSVHAKVLQSSHVPLFQVFFYYACQFTKRAEILIPIALMISSIKVLVSANLRHEIVALTTGGISFKNILSPFLGASLLFSLFLYANFQWIQPLSLNKIESFEESYFREAQKGENTKVNALILEDNSLLIYQTYDQEKRAFCDVFWLKSCDEFCRIHSLFPYEKCPIGHYVDEIVRTPEGEIVKRASFEQKLFPEIHFGEKALFSAVHPPRMQALSHLFNNLNWSEVKFGIGKMSDKEAELSSALFSKALTPLVCIFAILGPAPFCLRFTRSPRVFLIYALSLFGMVTFFTLLNSSLILGESQILPPLLALALPHTIALFIFGWKYAKL